jgi:hypothetical protein
MTVVSHGAIRTGITEGQREAIKEAMKLILEEDRDRGLGPNDRFQCAFCDESREIAGAVTYGEFRLCNACATDFEVERLGRNVHNVSEYVGRRRPKRSA